MTINPKIVLVCATCIIVSGFFGSYKSYQIYKDQVIDSQVVKSQRVAEFAGQNIEQKLSQIEASVSYLDQSTVETLKRFGVRYFAYAYQKQGEWSIKWKVLGAMDKAAILSEVKPLAFSDLAETSRHWARSTDDQVIYIAPVKLAESHQLKEGFLVFGLQDTFFESLKGVNENYILVDPQGFGLFGEFPTNLEAQKSHLINESQQTRFVEQETSQGLELTTASFLPKSQMWVIRQESMAAVTFASSRFFSYFLLTTGMGLFLLVLLLVGRPSAPITAPPIRKGKGPFAGLLARLKPMASMIRAAFTSAEADEIEETEDLNFPSEEVQKISNFADFLDQIISEEMARLKKVGVNIKTQVEEEATVVCSPQRVTDFIKRLIGNSVLSLDGETEKEIQIQLVEQAGAYQLIYVDTRSKNFPSEAPSSLMAQTEGSLQGIDGIIAYAGWLFGDRLTVAKHGFCLSIDLPKPPVEQTVSATLVSEEPKVIPIEQTLERIDPTPELQDFSAVDDRIEINDSDTDFDLISGFEALEPAKKPETSNTNEVSETEEPKVSFEDVIDQFRMKDFSFQPTPGEETASDAEVEALLAASPSIDTPEAIDSASFTDISAGEPVSEAETLAAEPEEDVELQEDEKGFFELNSGNFKIKIRSPRKRGSDVSR